MSIAETLQKIFYVCRTGCQWRAIEGMDGVSCKTVYHWFRKWSKARVFEHAFYNLVQAYINVTFNPINFGGFRCGKLLFHRVRLCPSSPSSVEKKTGEDSWSVCLPD